MSIITEDKIKHFVAGYAITLTIGLFFGYLIGAAAAVVVGVGKEIYDKVTGKGTPELLDLVATAAGALTAAAITLAATGILNLLDN